MPVSVRRATLAEIVPLRHAELRPRLPRTSAAFDGDDDATTIHVGAFESDGTVVGCASLMRRPLDGHDAWQLRGMATRGDRVRQGIGKRVLAAAVADACADGPRLLWCNARIAAVPFYERHGWCVVSAIFEIPTIGPHQRMRKECGT